MEKIKVIIVDDNKEITKIIKMKLEKFEMINILGVGYSAKDEIELIEKLKPDIVITDFVRNGIKSGMEIINKYKYKNKSKNPKFLVISSEDFKVEYTEICDGFIKKPIIDLEVIIKELKRIIENMFYENNK